MHEISGARNRPIRRHNFTPPLPSSLPAFLRPLVKMTIASGCRVGISPLLRFADTLYLLA